MTSCSWAAAFFVTAGLLVACGQSGDDGASGGANALSGNGGANAAAPATPAAKATSTPAAAAAPVSWEGQWTAEFDGGKTAGGDGIFIEYVVTVHGDQVTVSADGFQTESRINGTAKASGSDLLVTYDSCGAEDLFHCNTLTKGDALLHLHRDGQQSTLVFDKMPAEGNNLPLKLTNQGPWQGPWAAEFDGGQTAGGDGIFIEYAIVVEDKKVTISADGFQTETRMNGVGTADGNDLVVTFDSCGADDLFKCNTVAKGDTLFRLHRDGTQSSIAFDKMTAEVKTLPLTLRE
jgi:hypothetical protein